MRIQQYFVVGFMIDSRHPCLNSVFELRNGSAKMHKSNKSMQRINIYEINV